MNYLQINYILFAFSSLLIIMFLIFLTRKMVTVYMTPKLTSKENYYLEKYNSFVGKDSTPINVELVQNCVFKKYTIVLFLSIIIVLLTGYVITVRINDSAFQTAITNTKTYAKKVSEILTRDKHYTITPANALQTPVYFSLIGHMADFIALTDTINGLYTIRMTPSGDVIYIAVPPSSKAQSQNDGYPAPGDLYQHRSVEMIDAFDGKSTIEEFPSDNSWGKGYRLFYPVFDDRSRLESVLCVDINVMMLDHHNGYQTTIVIAVTSATILFALILFLIMYNHRIEALQAYLDQKKFEALATTDSLTGIFNRYRFEEMFTIELSRVKRYKCDLSLIMFDIDNYKSINDSLGHLTGDKALIELSEAVNSSIRKTDIFCRWGGDEFVVLFTETDLNSAIIACEKIRKAINETNFIINHPISCSFGLTTYSVGDTEDTMIKKADLALYAAKENGKNRVEIFNSDNFPMQ